jgi:hypothetical protein
VRAGKRDGIGTGGVPRCAARAVMPLIPPDVAHFSSSYPLASLPSTMTMLKESALLRPKMHKTTIHDAITTNARL